MEILLRISLFMLKILSYFLYPIFWLLSVLRSSKKVPVANDKLLNLSATVLADKIRKREIRSETVIRAYINRIKEVNQIINAVVEDRFDEALQDAINVDKRLSTDNEVDADFLKATQPLLGVPITIKETCAVKGMSQCVGSLHRLNCVALEDGEAVKLVRKAGAIILLTTNTPEFSCYWEANNLVTGLTKNPYNTHYSPAGSSSGEGALLASSASVIGLGSDVAGSIRLPGLVNGVFGHKGTTGIVPIKGHFPAANTEEIENSLVIGPLVRFAEDLPLLFNVLSGDKSAGLNLNQPVELCNLNVYSMHHFANSIAEIGVTTETKDAVNKCVEHLRKVCLSNVSQYKFPMKNSLEITNSYLYHSGGLPNILENPEDQKARGSVVLESMKKLCCLSKYSLHALFFESLSRCKGNVMAHQVKKYLKELEELKLLFQEKLEDNGVLICPTFPTHCYFNNEFFFKISGVQYLSIFNVLELPCTNVPLGLAKNKMPIGVQVVAAKHQDRLCFAVAKELENAFGGWTEIN